MIRLLLRPLARAIRRTAPVPCCIMMIVTLPSATLLARPCCSRPALQVSALMLMVALCRGAFHDLRQASLHASLALRMSELVDIPPELRAMAEFFSTGNIELHRQSDLLTWPPLAAPPEQPFYKRIGLLWGFMHAQLKVVSGRCSLRCHASQVTRTGLFSCPYAGSPPLLSLKRSAVPPFFVVLSAAELPSRDYSSSACRLRPPDAGTECPAHQARAAQVPALGVSARGPLQLHLL